MTIIVAIKDKNKILLGADTLASGGWNSTHRQDTKIFKSHGIGYGFTSSYRMGQILRYHTTEVIDPLRNTDLFGYVVKCLIPMYREILTKHGYTNINNNEETGGQFLVVIDGEIFEIHGDFQVSFSVDGFEAVGCGVHYAKGSLISTKSKNIDDRLHDAIDAAKYFSNGCGGETTTMEFCNESTTRIQN